VGGSDVVMEMVDNNEFEELIIEALKSKKE